MQLKCDQIQFCVSDRDTIPSFKKMRNLIGDIKVEIIKLRSETSSQHDNIVQFVSVTFIALFV